MVQPLYLYEELRGLVEVLNREGIPYAVCDGIAVAFYGYVRTTGDIDVLVRPEDVERIATVIRERGFVFDAGRIPFDVGGPRQRAIHRISKIVDDEILTLDLLLVDEVYRSIWDSREAAEWQGRPISVVSLDGLLEMKRIAGRNKDLLDIDELTKGTGPQ
jgi:Uncharacterised nucleotidyltransferase